MAYLITVLVGIAGYLWGRHHIGLVHHLYYQSPYSIWSWLTWIGATVLVFLISMGISALAARMRNS